MANMRTTKLWEQLGTTKLTVDCISAAHLMPHFTVGGRASRFELSSEITVDSVEGDHVQFVIFGSRLRPS